jgi:hypothetical protein
MPKAGKPRKAPTEKIRIARNGADTIVTPVTGTSLFKRLTGGDKATRKAYRIEGKSPDDIAARLRKIAPDLKMAAKLYKGRLGDYTCLLWDRTPMPRVPAYRRGWINNTMELCREVGEDPRNNPIRLVSRRIYKSTECGAWVAEMKEGDAVRGITVGSIVEGVEQETTPIDLRFPFTKKAFWQAVQDTEEQAGEIWQATHGCRECARHRHTKWQPGATAVWPGCPKCKGRGVAI